MGSRGKTLTLTAGDLTPRPPLRNCGDGESRRRDVRATGAPGLPRREHAIFLRRGNLGGPQASGAYDASGADACRGEPLAGAPRAADGRPVPKTAHRRPLHPGLSLFRARACGRGGRGLERRTCGEGRGARPGSPRQTFGSSESRRPPCSEACPRCLMRFYCTDRRIPRLPLSAIAERGPGGEVSCGEQAGARRKGRIAPSIGGPSGPR